MRSLPYRAGPGSVSRDRQFFFVQEAPREQWHVESDENCEVMLCGKTISVEAPLAKIQYRWGPKKCPDCFLLFGSREGSLP